MSSALQGVLPVLQLPFHEDESIVFDTLGREIDWLYQRGVAGLVRAIVSKWLRLADEETPFEVHRRFDLVNSAVKESK